MPKTVIEFTKMKNTFANPTHLTRWTAWIICAASMVATQIKADTLVTFSVDMSVEIANNRFVPGTDTVAARGTFNGYGQLNLVQEGGGTVYTNTADDSLDANGGQMQYKFWNSDSAEGNTGWESLATGQNRSVLLPTNSGASLNLPTQFYNDLGPTVTNLVNFQVDVSQQIALGVFTPGSSSVEVRGLFNSWTGGAFPLTNDPNIMVTNQFGLVTSNVWVGQTAVAGSPACVEAYKYVIQPGTVWESPDAVDSDGGGNRYFFNVPQTLPLVDFSDEPYAPLSTNLFSVDMSAQLLLGNWNPNMQVALAGSFNNWNTGAPYMTNNPSAANTNIYYEAVVLGEGSTPQYKFTYQGSGGTVWENPNPPTIGGNRFFVVPTTTNYYVLPTVSFSDLSINDLLQTDIWVTFSVVLTTNSAQYPSGPNFNPSSDEIFVNSPDFNGSWNGWDPISLSSYVLTNNLSYGMAGDGTYTNYLFQGTFQVAMGQSFDLTYKYSIDGSDDEAASGNNHGRVIRSIATGSYALPIDTFGNQYNEPAFGQLAAAPAAGGNVQVSWLGAPNVTVQTSSNLTTGAWVNHPETSGTVWSSGVNSTNGLVTVTNWPASGSLYFRLLENN